MTNGKDTLIKTDQVHFSSKNFIISPLPGPQIYYVNITNIIFSEMVEQHIGSMNTF